MLYLIHTNYINHIHILWAGFVSVAEGTGDASHCHSSGVIGGRSIYHVDSLNWPMVSIMFTPAIIARICGRILICLWSCI